MPSYFTVPFIANANAIAVGEGLSTNTITNTNAFVADGLFAFGDANALATATSVPGDAAVATFADVNVTGPGGVAVATTYHVHAIWVDPHPIGPVSHFSAQGQQGSVLSLSHAPVVSALDVPSS